MSDGGGLKVAVVAAHSTSPADGIRDYTERLVRTLQDRPGVTAELYHRAPSAFATRLSSSEGHVLGPCAQADAVIVQYNPFWYGRRGFAPGLPVGMLQLKRSAPNATIALMVHETYVDPKNWKWALMSAWQRTQLRALQRVVDVQLCSIEAWADRLQRSAPEVPARHLPVPSNLPDRRAARAMSRARLGLEDATIVLATFGLRHPGRLSDHMLEAARAVSDAHHRVAFINLGTGEPGDIEVEDRVRLISPGLLEETDAAEALAAADIFLGAFADGVSTRRTTLMAALQHGIACVGTSGHLTDSVLLEAPHALRLSPVLERDEFVASVVELAARPELRSELALAGRRLYEEKFDWPVLVDALLEAIQQRRA